MSERKPTERKRIEIPLPTALRMLGDYAAGRIGEQVRSVAFIIVYLLAFQIVILGSPPANALAIALGIGLVVLGLALFLEGLLLGLMPLGERVGLQLPKRTGIVPIVLFGLLLGFGSTLAEPAIAALRTAGESVTAWETPLLFLMLERHPEALVSAVGVGVGIAVAFGMVRFYFGLSLKPFVLTVIPLLLVISAVFSFDEKLAAIVALAWDTGAVTTGPVTVPLVLALGIGVSRATGKGENTGGGFGIIMLASAFPILSVLLLAGGLRSDVPRPTEQQAFFSPAFREQALKLFETPDELERHAFTRAGESGRRALFEDEDAYHAALEALREDENTRRRLLGEMSLSRWLSTTASDAERERFPRVRRAAERAPVSTTAPGPGDADRGVFARVFAEEGRLAIRAVVPLSALLLFVLLLLLRDRPRYRDEVVLGILLALVGMMVLTSGIRLGLAPLGDDVGARLPRVFADSTHGVERVVIDDFDREVVFESIGPDGDRRSYFYLHDNGEPERVRFIPERFDEARSRYEHVIERTPLFGPELTALGIALVLVFAFGLGYGSTLAEPALNALGRTVEDMTVGTVKRSSVIRAVSIGVGVGLVAGVARIMYDIPVIWLLAPPYLLLLPLTFWSEEEFAGVAWDSGGVTTGPVTVPLVLAMGLGIGSELGVVDGFGVVSMASVFPILSVSLYGFMVRARQRRAIRDAERSDGDE